MKKSIILLITAVAALSACTKGESYYDVVGGRSSEYSSEGRSYMMYIADNLVTDALDEIELGITVNQAGTHHSSHFAIGGSFVETGAVWTVTSDDNRLEGLIIRCAGPDKWELKYSGKYSFGHETYPTEFQMTATREMVSGSQYNCWHVTLQGTRTEREGYSCEFETPDGQELVYTNTLGSEVKGWNKVEGNLDMVVNKNGKTVDVCRLSFHGAPSAADFVRNL